MPFTEVSSDEVFRHPAPYSMATLSGAAKTLHISGQVPQDKFGNNVGKDSAYEQTKFILKNIEALVTSAGGDLKDVCRLTIYMTKRECLKDVMAARAELLAAPFPATTALVVAALANEDWLIEIEATAALP